MTAIYIIDHTDPANGSFTINPNKLNGPGSVAQNTNLSLYGAGALRYGEGMNESLLHLLENFASPEATTGGSPDVGLGIPDLAYFNPAKAIKGQLWFNSSTDKLMMYNGSNWISSGGTSVGTTAPVAPAEGDLWFDSSTTQLKVYYSAAWTSVADHYVRLDGVGAMTGILTLSGDPSADLHAATKKYVDDQITANDILGELSDVTMSGSEAAGDILYYNGADWVDHTLIMADISDITATASEINNTQGQLALKADLAGPALTGNPTAPTQSAANNSTRIATTAYVTSGIATATAGLGASVPEIFVTTSAPIGKDGDIWYDNVAFKLYIKGDSWRQVWPAQYS